MSFSGQSLCQHRLIKENILLPPSGFRKYRDYERPSQLTVHSKGDLQPVFSYSPNANLFRVSL